MKQKQIALFGVLIVLMIGIAVFLVSNNNSSSNDSEDVSLKSLLPTEKLENIEEAQGNLSYELMLPTETDGATLDEIQQGLAGSQIDTSDTLYLTYVKDSNTHFKVSISSQSFNDPTEDAKEIKINGEKAYFYYIGSSDTDAITTGNVSVPTSYLFWLEDGIRYEVSEFGEVDENTLKDIAESFIKLD